MRATPSKIVNQPIAIITPLSEEKRLHLPTREAAPHLNRQAQTLRKWASERSGPIQPIRIHGQLGWSVAALRELNKVSA